MRLDSTYQRVPVKTVLRYYIRAARPYKLLYALTFAGGILFALSASVGPIFYKRFFDALVAGGDKATLYPQLLSAILFVLLFNFLAWLFYRAGEFVYNYVVPKTSARLREQAFDKLLHHSYDFFVNTFAGSLVQRVGRYARAYEQIIDKIRHDFLVLVVRISASVFILSLYNGTLAVVILLWGFGILILNIFLVRLKIKLDIERARQDSVLTGTLADSLSNHQTIASFAHENDERRRFGAVVLDHFKISVWTAQVDEMIGALFGFINLSTEFLLFYFALRYWEAGTLTVGTFVLAQAYFLSIMSNLWSIGRIIQVVTTNVADASEMVEILELAPGVPDIPHAKGMKPAHGEIVLDHVSYGYKDGREIFDDFSLSIPPGQRVAIIGPSGAGKSTFVKLLMRFSDVGAGTITIDGRNIREVTQESLRKAIAYVPQDPALFHRSLMENIRYGRLDATNDEVKAVAHRAHCDEFIDRLPQGYETLVGERGIKLSGGERQRVAIARALLKNAPILVLDEATSSLDSHSESLIQDALDTLMKGRTTIVIAHRLSTIRKMDRIIVLNEGKIVEDGSHEELLKKRVGLYKKLWKLQAGGFLTAA